MIDFAAIMEHAFANRPYESDIHGIEHWHQVEYNGMMLASILGADVDIVRLFSIFHDSKRFDDGHDPEHGERGAEFAKECREAKLFEIDDERFEKLYHACKFHTHERKNDDITIACCYDADRLDLGRVGFPLDPEKMATSLGSRIAKQSLKERVSVFAMREWIKTLNLP
ncbi:MAG: hypothetical protein J5791_01325 [Fibrobacter sp.]|nr:hypothetical protein [Fibrobacter sp.]